HITLEMAPLEIRHRSVRPISAKHAQASRFLQQSPREDLGSSGAKGDEGCFYAVARFSLPQDRGNVHLDGAGSEVQRFRDLSVRLSLAEPDQDLSLASREAFEAFDGARVLGVRRRDAGVEQTPGDRGREERSATGDGVHTGDQLA